MIWKWCWTKLDIATSWKTKNFFFHFSTWELVEKNSIPVVFYKFLRNPPKSFGINYGIFEGFNLWCSDGRIIVGGRPYPKLWRKYKKPYSQDFIDFAIKTHWIMIFFTNLSQVSVIFIYYCLILLYLSDFELKQRNKFWKFLFTFWWVFIAKSMKSWIGFFVFSPKLWVGSTPNNESTIKTSQIEPFRNSLFFYTNILAGSGENWKKREGSNCFQLVPMLKNENFCFCFP